VNRNKVVEAGSNSLVSYRANKKSLLKYTYIEGDGVSLCDYFDGGF
jgi:hypothetical protein